MDYNDPIILLSPFLLDAVESAGITPQPIAAACTSQGCTTCEGGACEEMGCQTCQCAYMSGQCGQGCGESCGESCAQSCGESLPPTGAYISASTDYSESSGVFIQAQMVDLDQTFWDNWESTRNPRYVGTMTFELSGVSGSTRSSGKSTSVNCYSKLVSWTGLQSGRTYTINCTINYITSSGDSMSTSRSKTITAASQPDASYFSWTSDALQLTKPVNNPLSSGMIISNYLKVVRWNNLISLCKTKTGITSGYTSAVKGQALKATQYNQLVDALSSRIGFNASSYYVRANSQVTAAKLNQLQTWINSI